MKRTLLVFTLCLTILSMTGANKKACKPDEMEDNQGVLGGLQSMSIDTDLVKEIALNVTTLWNNQTNSSSFFRITCLKGVKKQVVTGDMYHLNVLVGQTNCSKSKMPAFGLLKQSDVDACVPVLNGASFQCNWKYWVRSWLKSYLLNDSKCQ